MLKNLIFRDEGSQKTRGNCLKGGLAKKRGGSVFEGGSGGGVGTLMHTMGAFRTLLKSTMEPFAKIVYS